MYTFTAAISIMNCNLKWNRQYKLFFIDNAPKCFSSLENWIDNTDQHIKNLKDKPFKNCKEKYNLDEITLKEKDKLLSKMDNKLKKSKEEVDEVSFFYLKIHLILMKYPIIIIYVNDLIDFSLYISNFSNGYRYTRRLDLKKKKSSRRLNPTQKDLKLSQNRSQKRRKTFQT